MTIAERLASLRPTPVLAGAFLIFVAAAFLLPTEPAYALVFYLAVVPAPWPGRVMAARCRIAATRWRWC